MPVQAQKKSLRGSRLSLLTLSEQMTEPSYRVRMATAEDAPVIAYQRAAMFYDMGSVSDNERATLEAAVLLQIREMIRRGDYFGWLIEGDDKILAGGGVILRRLLPRPGSLQGGEEAYILNVYVEPDYRRRGLARRIMETILVWCQQRQVARVTLHPSDEGQPLYESLGFERTKEMLLQRRPQE